MSIMFITMLKLVWQTHDFSILISQQVSSGHNSSIQIIHDHNTSIVPTVTSTLCPCVYKRPEILQDHTFADDNVDTYEQN